MRSFELRILVLHPHLDDVANEDEILLSNEKVLKPLLGKFESPWICEIRYANAEKEINAMITLRRIMKGGDPEFRQIIDAFCDELFRVDCDTSLESIRNGEKVLFKPDVDTKNNVVDQAFLRSFIISMGKGLTGNLAFSTPKIHGKNFFTRQPNRWFMGPMQAIVTLAECEQGLGRFLELIPPRKASSTNPHTTAFIECPLSESVEIQDTAQKVNMVLSIIRGGDKIVNLLQAGLLQLVRLDEGELNRAIDDASQRLDNTTEALLSTLDTLLGPSGIDKSPQNIDEAINLLNSSIEQAYQLLKWADTETAAYRGQCMKWTGFTALSLMLMGGGFLVSGGGAPIVAAKVVCIGGGALSATGCGYKTWKEWCKKNDAKEVGRLVGEVHKVFCRTWVFLTIAHWLRIGRFEDDQRMMEFANRMAQEFKINDLLTNWKDKEYAASVITNNRNVIAQDMRNMMEAVRKRRGIPSECQPTEDDAAHQASPIHNVLQETVVEVNGQNLLQGSISSAGGESTLGEPESSSAITESEDSTSDLQGHLGQLHLPAQPESDGWGSDDVADLEASFVSTPTELSNDWDN